ncbi:response regulator [Diaphorobacter aerolatus]|uniref:Response regulator transcription factor n=1 Tax=Diaphorobacter aerolatus TaxID=1288495 RepID=A0A7H0GKK2_9BURK|nr:response regulator transcription factor [Diaphorobacter aerolatus]QNP48818.1 response regulator transcription factor [Diaphorobacter aerolatus]
MDKKRVVIADDHPAVLYALNNLIALDSRFDVISCTKSAAELIRFLRNENHVDIVVTDFSMPNDSMYGDGVRYVKYLVRNFPGRRVVVFSDYITPSLVFSLYDYGVSAVVLKNHEPAEMLQALNCIVSNRVYYPPGVNRRICACSRKICMRFHRANLRCCASSRAACRSRPSRPTSIAASRR